jgi:hypothetical protein
MVDLITPGELIPQPHEFVLRNGTPDTIAGWKALGDGLLTDQSCAFHRNLEISSRYAWIYKLPPACLKWAGMAAFASHHVRFALFPLRLDTDRSGYVDIPHSLGRQKALLIADVNTIRETYSLTRGIPQVLHAQAWPRITRFDDRWRWIVTSIVPRFRRFDADLRLADASLRRIFDEARDYASNPCVLPRSPQTEESAPNEQPRTMATSLD